MKTTIKVQKPKTRNHDTIFQLLKTQLDAMDCNVVRVAVAYATISGVRLFLDIIDEYSIKESHWLIGLDDTISQPDAIDLLMETENSKIRVAGYENKGLRFHPKVFMFEGRDRKALSFLMVGSANLTASALLENGEAVVALIPQKNSERSDFLKAWSNLWKQGHTATKKEISAYRKRYELAQIERKRNSRIEFKPHRKRRGHKFIVLQSDSAKLDPSFANLCWIECGRNTAMGRELEFKAEQGLFFGLPPSGGNSKIFGFRVSDGSTTRLRMKYQGNHMWRLQLNSNVPEVKAGLRPLLKNGKLGRSPYVAVIERTKTQNEFTLRFIRLKSEEFVALEEKTLEFGTLGRTPARKYGWC